MQVKQNNLERRQMWTKREEVINALKAVMDDDDFEFLRIGVRFCQMDLKSGDEAPTSKRFFAEDGRDFPEFGSDEYADLDELNGTSSYDIDFFSRKISSSDYYPALDGHLYIIAGERAEHGED